MFNSNFIPSIKIDCMGSFFKANWLRVFVAVAAVSILYLLPLPALAEDGEGYGEKALLVSVESANIILGTIATVFFIGLAWQSGASRQGVGVGYIACGIALLTFTRIFYILADRGTISISDDTLEMWWHLIFFLAMFACGIGGKILVGDSEEHNPLDSLLSLKLWSILAAVLTAAVFLSAEWLDKPFVAVFQDSIWDIFGAQHFVAFVVAALALLHIGVSVSADSSNESANLIDRLKLPLMITYGLFSVDHFWELLTESWEIFEFSEEIIERTEQIIVLPAFVVLAYVGWKLWTHDAAVPKATSAAE